MNKKLRRWFGGVKMMFFRLLIQPLCWFFRRRADRVVFSTFDGNGFMDNSKYVAQELIRRNFPGELIWLTSPGKKADFPPEVRRVSNKFFSELYYLATAGVWVDTHFKRHIFKKGLVKRSDQLYIQTWHGSLGIKAMKPITESSPSIYYPTLADVGSVNYMISNSTFENEYYRDWFFTPEVQPEIFMAGHPRNDIFFRDNSELVERLKRNFNLQTDDRIFTYMPTFRKGHFCDSFGLDFGRIRAALADTFGGNWYIFMRLHPGARQELQNKFDEPGVIDVSRRDGCVVHRLFFLHIRFHFEPPPGIHLCGGLEVLRNQSRTALSAYGNAVCDR